MIQIVQLIKDLSNYLPENPYARVYFSLPDDLEGVISSEEKWVVEDILWDDEGDLIIQLR